MSVNQPQPNEPVTLIVRHSVKPGSEAAFDDWLRGIGAVAMTYAGHMGINVIRPAPGSDGKYVNMFRFDNAANFQIWMDSKDRQDHLEKLRPLVNAMPDYEEVCGMEYWFENDDAATPKPSPSRVKMTVVTWLALTPLLLIFEPILIPQLTQLSLPSYVITSIFAALMVILMVYAAMPLMTRIFKRWLYPPLK